MDAPLKAADAFIHNQASGAVERLGYGWDCLQTGPYSAHKAFDVLVQGEAGFSWVTGSPDEPAIQNERRSRRFCASVLRRSDLTALRVETHAFSLEPGLAA